MTAEARPVPSILITRPRAGAERFARQIRARFGADRPVLISPLIAIRPTGAEIPPAEGYIFTSEQAVHLVPKDKDHAAPGKTAWCVGIRTAEAARAEGFNVIEGPGNATGLWRLMLAEAPQGRLIHVRGAEVSTPLAEMLRDSGLDVGEAVAYRQERQPLSDAAQALIAAPGPVLVPVFSPRSAHALCVALEGHRAELRLAVISGAVAKALAPLGTAQIETAPEPTAEGVLDALSRFIAEENRD